MLQVPNDKQELLQFSHELIETCRASVGARESYYRLLNIITETGRYDGTKALINFMFKHVDRTAAHIYSPVELKFTVDFEHPQPKRTYQMAAEVGKSLTRNWGRSNTDTVFGRGVFEALKYGWCGLKQWVQTEGAEHTPKYYKKLVMPWQFGVYREDENDIDRQEALCETSTLTLPEVWQRIWHLPNADKLFKKIKTHSRRGQASEATTYFHQVLSTSQLDTGLTGRSGPGGIVQLGGDPNYALMGPVVAADLVEHHELWVKDEEDYTTIQLISPDIMIAPLYKKANLLIAGSRLHPYTTIQPNEVTNWFWGRSELVDLIEPQGLLAIWFDDLKRLFGLQIDKILAFVGEAGITDERYAQFRSAGYFSLPQGASVNDLTPHLPPEALPLIKFVLEMLNVLGGFPPIMQGQGESGVRAGSHANTLMKTASPTLRDRSLLVERQCAMAADKTLSMMEAKDERKYWLKADNPIKDVEETSFLLSELPDDWHVTVDSHSGSPIFSDENTQLIVLAQKMGVVDGDYFIDNTALPNKEIAKTKLREKEAKQAEQMQALLQLNPEMAQKMMQKKLMGGRR